MKNILFILCMIISLASLGQNNLSTVSIQLKDQTKLMGTIQFQNESEIKLNDFSIGIVTIKKDQIITMILQDGPIFLQIILGDGKIVIGKLVQQDSQSFVIETKNLGTISIFRANAKSITFIGSEQIKNGQFFFPNPHPTRYFFGPSAIPLKKGEKYFQNAYLLSNSIQIGLTDQFSIGGGVVIPFLFYLTPKIGKKIAENIHIGGGLLIASSFISDLNVGLAVGYGSITLGTQEDNVTLNAGWGASKENNYDASTGISRNTWGAASRPMFTLSGMTRISKKCMLLTENWFVSAKQYQYDVNGKINGAQNTYNMIFSGGIRIMGEKNSFDIGILSPIVTGNTGFGIPYVDYVIKF